MILLCTRGRRKERENVGVLQCVFQPGSEKLRPEEIGTCDHRLIVFVRREYQPLISILVENLKSLDFPIFAFLLLLSILFDYFRLFSVIFDFSNCLDYLAVVSICFAFEGFLDHFRRGELSTMRLTTCEIWRTYICISGQFDLVYCRHIDFGYAGVNIYWIVGTQIAIY